MGITRPFTLFNKKKTGLLVIAFIVIIAYWLCLPNTIFNVPYSTALYDKDKILLNAIVADDGQWRFPQQDSVPYKFEQAILAFEDQYFYKHPGVNPVSISRALIQNIKKGKVISGGSTISMQVIRLSRNKRSRTIKEKIIEIILATRLELGYSKKNILTMYAAHAPFGSNIVGIEAAAWRFFGTSPDKLSWAEAATLAVLPNAPGLIYPGKNQQRLLIKRNTLLQKLNRLKIIDDETYLLATKEPLPVKPHAIPMLAPHLLAKSVIDGLKGTAIESTIDMNLQTRVNEIIEKHHLRLSENQIHNAAALVIDVSSGSAIAYVGNTTSKNRNYGNDVDIIQSPRSTGSILKPFLFAAMLNDGELLSNTLVPDIPTSISGYAPQNFNLTYDGMVPARKALSRSLNIPAVKMLQNYGVERFRYVLKKMGMTTIKYSANHYGLSLILGGAEGTLWDIAGMYAGMARTLKNYEENNHAYIDNEYHPNRYTQNRNLNTKKHFVKSGMFDVGSIALTFEAMLEVNRPDIDASWKLYSSSTKVAWKTGTSFGFRDGWAIGITPTNVVAVWVGNASGEGRPGLTGIGTAAPILFEIIGLLETSTWFKTPKDDMVLADICTLSGHRAGTNCDTKQKEWIQKAGTKTTPCTYHQLIHLDMQGKYRVNSDCEDVSKMLHKTWFVIPPAEEYYYQNKNPLYKKLPELRSDCKNNREKTMDFIYPKEMGNMYIPTELDGKLGKVVFEVAHRKNNAVIYWSLDNNFIGTTTHIHQMGIAPSAGLHVLTLVDDEGQTISEKFTIIEKRKK